MTISLKTYVISSMFILIISTLFGFIAGERSVDEGSVDKTCWRNIIESYDLDSIRLDIEQGWNGNIMHTVVWRNCNKCGSLIVFRDTVEKFESEEQRYQRLKYAREFVNKWPLK